MWKQLDKLRQKSEPEKKAFALLFSLGLTAVILITWATMLFSSFSETIHSEEINQTASPFSAIRAQLKEFGGQIAEIKDLIKDEI